jgi:hypothetical protein
VVPNLFDGITIHSRRKPIRGWYIHLDNACPHNARQSTDVFKQRDPAYIAPGI